MNLACAFEESARKNSGKPAIFWGEEVIKYDLLLRDSNVLANYLLNKFQITPGERIAIWLKNCPEYVPVLFGIFQADGVVVPINNFFKPDEVTYILRDCGARVLISDSSMREGTSKLREAIPGLQVLELESLLAQADSSKESALDAVTRSSIRSEQDLAVI